MGDSQVSRVQIDRIRQLIYLDEYKLYSLSSQLFEGLTEYQVRYEQSAEADKEKQEGPFTTGKLLTHLDTVAKSQEERRLLYDHAYALFETELKKQGAIIEYGPDSDINLIEKAIPGSFIKVKGWPDFNDMQVIKRTLQNHNELAATIAYFHVHGKKSAEMALSGKGTKALKIQKDEINQTVEQLRLGSFDEEYTNKLIAVLNYGYGDHFEVRVCPFGDDPGKPFVSALLKRDYLREEEEFIIRKFSRRAPESFCLVGIVCQGPASVKRPEMKPISAESVENVKPTEPEDFRQAIDVMVSALAELEGGFIGRRPHEIIIDPVALYREVDISPTKST